MRPASALITLTSLLPLALGSGTLDIRGSAFNASEISELSSCLLECAAKVLPLFDCNAGEDCYCDTKGPLKDALGKCIASTCASIEEALAGARIQAQVCGYPRHTDAPNTNLNAFVLFGFVTVFLVARTLYRWPRLGGAGYGWDDWTLYLCYPLIIAFTVESHFAAVYGSGKDMYYLTAKELKGFALCMYLGEPIYPSVTYLGKVSVLFLYLRIWPADVEPKSKFRRTCWVLIILLIMTAVTFIFTSIFSCHPVEAGWSLQVTASATCINRTAAGYVMAVLNILFDLVILLLPVPRLLRLQIGLSDKICVLVTFLLGFIVTICSVVRLFYLHQTAIVSNITYYFSFVGLWSQVEVYCTFICCCLPAAAGLVRRYWRSIYNNVTSAVSATVSSLRTRSDPTEANELHDFKSRISLPLNGEERRFSQLKDGAQSHTFAFNSFNSSSRSPPPQYWPHNRPMEKTLEERFELEAVPHNRNRQSTPEFWFYDSGGEQDQNHLTTGMPIAARFSGLRSHSPGTTPSSGRKESMRTSWRSM